MIQFKITNTPEKSQQSVYQHEGEQIVIGKEEGDLIIDDPAIAPRQLRIYFEAGNFYLENLDPSVEIKVAGKPIEEPIHLHGKEILNFGKTTLALTLINTLPAPLPETFYYNRSDRFATGKTERVILDALEFLASPLGDPLARISLVPPSADAPVSSSPAVPPIPGRPAGNILPPKPGIPKPPIPKPK